MSLKRVCLGWVCSVLVEIQPVAAVLDETLADDSSSSSSEEEHGGDGNASSGRRRSARAAAAARPPGSTMPGWIGQVQQEKGSGSSSLLCSPGRLCRVQAWLPAQAVDWAEAARAAVTQLAAGVAAAGLTASDVVACKAYCLAELLERGHLSAALCAAVEEALPHASPCIVPVSAVGPSAAADCGVLLELLGCRVPA